MKKIYLVILGLALVSASCNPFAKPVMGGIAKTVNGGSDWQAGNAMAVNEQGNIAILNISKLAFDPQNRETVYAGGYNGGLYKSTDSAVTWRRILTNISVFEFAINPNDGKNIYAAGISGGFGQVVATKDGGATWEEMYRGEKAGDTENAVRAIALNPANPNQLVIGTENGNIIKSSDGGISWQLAIWLESQVKRIVWQNGNIYALTQTKGLKKSSDSGETFTNLTDSFNGSFGIGSVSFNTGSNQAFNQFYVDPISSSLIYLTTSSGLFKTTDEGKTWNTLPLPLKQSQSNVRAIAVAKSTANLVFASVGGTVYKSTDGGMNWQTQGIASAGFINYILVDTQLPQIVYAGIYGQ